MLQLLSELQKDSSIKILYLPLTFNNRAEVGCKLAMKLNGRTPGKKLGERLPGISPDIASGSATLQIFSSTHFEIQNSNLHPYFQFGEDLTLKFLIENLQRHNSFESINMLPYTDLWMKESNI